MVCHNWCGTNLVHAFIDRDRLSLVVVVNLELSGSSVRTIRLVQARLFINIYYKFQ